MYTAPTAPYASTGANPANGIIGLLLAGSLVYILVLIACAIVSAYISYRIIKAAVRNGMVEAIHKTGLGESATFVQGYPPAQNYSAPPPPVAEYGGYRGPNG